MPVSLSVLMLSFVKCSELAAGTEARFQGTKRPMCGLVLGPASAQAGKCWLILGHLLLSWSFWKPQGGGGGVIKHLSTNAGSGDTL